MLYPFNALLARMQVYHPLEPDALHPGRVAQ